MKAIAIAAAALGVAALSSWSPPVNAATCFREIVNGQVVYADGGATGTTPGKVLRS